MGIFIQYHLNMDDIVRDANDIVRDAMHCTGVR